MELRKAGLSEGEGGGLAGFASKQKPVRKLFVTRLP